MCPAVQAPDNGDILTTRTSHHFGDVVMFQCRIGYIMTGSAAIQCQPSGQWNTTTPKCTPAQCVPLSDDPSEGLTVNGGQISFSVNVNVFFYYYY